MADQREEVWDEDKAKELMGALVLVGIDHLDSDGAFVSQEQYFGRVVEMDRWVGIKLKLEGARAGQEYKLPPDTGNLRRAEPGDYRLKSTGEIVRSPDFTSSWIITAPKGE